MPTKTKAATAIIPAVRYRDGPAAIEWLCAAFGFEKHLVVPGEGDTIAHAQLTLGNAMIMLGSGGHSDYSRLTKHPDEIGGFVTQSPYIIVPDADAHYERAKAAGAEIVRELNDTDYGSREYAARDLEGNVWSFGTYRPTAS